MEDNGNAIEQAIAKAKALKEKTGEQINWREVLFLTHTDMYKALGTYIMATRATASPNARPPQPSASPSNSPEPSPASENDAPGAAGVGGEDPADPEDQPAKESA